MSGSASCPPHDQQKRFPLDTSARQCGQIRASRAPQSSQNLAPAGFVAWHRGHRIEQVAKETNGDAGEPGEYTECRRRNSSAESSGGNQFKWMMLCHDGAKQIAQQLPQLAILSAIRLFCWPILLPLAEASSPPLTLGFWCDARHSVKPSKNLKKLGSRGNSYE